MSSSISETLAENASLQHSKGGDTLQSTSANGLSPVETQITLSGKVIASK